MKKRIVCVLTAIIVAMAMYVPSFGATTYTHSKLVKGKTIHKGIDVSQYQDDIDWAKVRKAGIEFAIIRVGYRDTNGKLYKDDKYLNNLKGAINNGLKVGVYYRTTALTTKEASAEADAFLDIIEGYDIDLPVFYDVEKYDRNKKFFDGDHKNTLANIANTFLDKVEAAGYETGMYSSRYYLEKMIATSKVIDHGHLIWVAEWNKSTSYGKRFVAWQYTSDGSVSGIDGRVDRDFFYGDKYFKDALQSSSSKNGIKKVIGVSKESRTRSSYEISWVKQKNADGYIIYRSDRYNGGYKEVGRTSGYSYTDKGLEPGRQYYYRVAAYKGSETAARSDRFTANVLPAYDRYGKLSKERIIRKHPGSSYSTVKTVKKGASVTILGQAYDKDGNKWYRVKYKKSGNTYSGYMKSGVFTITKKCTTTSKVNFRKGAGTSYGTYGTISKGKRLRIYEIKKVNGLEWYKVKYKINKKTRTGWISGNYCKAVNI